MEWTQEQIDAEVARLELTGEKLSTVVETRPFIDGRYYDDSDHVAGRIITSINPATGKEVAEIVACNETMVDVAVAAARASFESGVWSRKSSPAERKHTLLKFAALMADHTLELAVLDAVEGAFM